MTLGRCLRSRVMESDVTMADQKPQRILTINTGSSSIKAALYDLDGEERLTLAAHVERIGGSGSRVRITTADGKTLLDEQRDLPDHPAGLQALFAWLQQQQLSAAPDAIGHRVVYGGSRYSAPHLIDAGLMQALKEMVPIDPDHLPQAISAIEAARKAFPAAPQVACFDTAFHRSMPRVAQIYALPRQFADEGVLRYGFHGLSYEYILQTLRVEDPAA